VPEAIANQAQPNIVQYIEHVDWDEYLYIIMEYVPGGDLGSLINKYGRLQELEVKSMATQLLSALKYLHGQGITHRDVKPDNILIHSHRPFQVKLTDFGLSKMVDSEDTFLRTFCGTLLYCAPEVYSEYREYDLQGTRTLRGIDKKLLPPQRYDHAVDVWSLAGVLFFTLCASPPYPVKNGISYQELLHIIMTKPLDIRPLQKVDVSENGIRFIRHMLHIRPEHRATIPELESDVWITGASQSMESIDEEEVDLVQSGSVINPELEEGASQLSIHDPCDSQIGEPEEISGVNQYRVEIPNSFNTSDGNSNGNESSALTQNAGNGRLFGEVDTSALGSSGAIPSSLLPVPTVNHRDVRSMSTIFGGSMNAQSEPVHDTSSIQHVQQPPPVMTVTMVYQPLPTEVERHGDRASSLMGAESMVGHLNMHSPSAASSPAGSPAADAPTTVASPAQEGLSLRRPHEEMSSDDRSWQPADLPAKRVRKSMREIDMPAPQQLFWDPKDKSTHHNNYPHMTLSEFNTYQELAKRKGELFEHGHATFDTTMNSFRASRSPSVDPEATRAQSEPAKEGRRMMMKRDERKLGDGVIEASKTQHPAAKDQSLPTTAHGSNQPNTPETESSDITAGHGIVGHDFQPPKRILGKLFATQDSCLPTITLNIVETVTSWGRGFQNTIRYSNPNEIRVPKYAFKIFAFKLDNEWESAPPDPNFNTKGLAFYISSKASMGITINGVSLPSNDRQNPETPSKYWGELRHGDIITVWQHDIDRKQFTRFRFECYHGNSKDPRPASEPFSILPEGKILDKLEKYCRNHEKALLQNTLSPGV
jgi:serine/threonine protein kinase